jgi:hypothetical protein
MAINVLVSAVLMVDIGDKRRFNVAYRELIAVLMAINVLVSAVLMADTILLSIHRQFFLLLQIRCVVNVPQQC